MLIAMSLYLYLATFGLFCNALFSSASPLPTKRVIGGDIAEPGQFPYQAGLQTKIAGEENLETCGGSLIAQDYVLTAAHCLANDGTEYTQVHLGAEELRNPAENHLIITCTTDDFIVHERYYRETLANDIGLIKLPMKVELTDRIQLLALPKYSDSLVNLVGKQVVASGWGRYSDDSQEISPQLKYVLLEVENQRVCEHFHPALLSSNICTYTGYGTGPCTGDSGGPLTYTDPAGRTFIVGLPSFATDFGCVAPGWPTAFTRITSFLDWISAKTGIVIEE